MNVFALVAVGPGSGFTALSGQRREIHEYAAEIVANGGGLSPRN
jgi:hypothetical protein